MEQEKNKHTMHVKTIIRGYYIEAYTSKQTSKITGNKIRVVSLYVYDTTNKNKVLASISNVPTEKTIYDIAQELILLYEKRAIDKNVWVCYDTESKYYTDGVTLMTTMTEHEFDTMVSQYELLLTTHFNSKDKPFEIDYNYSAPSKLAFTNEELLVYVIEKADTVEFKAYNLESFEESKIALEEFSNKNHIIN